MKANFLMWIVLAAIAAASLASSAAARPPFRGYFGDYNQTFYYGRAGTQYYRTYQNARYPQMPYRYYQQYGGTYGNTAPGYAPPVVLPGPPR
jgi:hypothetical protein